MIISPLSELCKFYGCYTTLRGFYFVRKNSKIQGNRNSKKGNYISGEILVGLINGEEKMDFVSRNPYQESCMKVL
ncbi:hypothetical protein SRABI133_01872 [Peribacillus simplex]|uniref:Uncharacterized protein n=1 Tax=Peribacillus simplex TaxID=1478 RepID=A0A9W4KY11_9BACI|nr:hypothetical protein SRABI133_01872 [Peribacillus simplex]